MLYSIKHLHLELSSLCNARCPFCPRNLNGYPYNFGYKETNISLADIKKIFLPQTIESLEQILINGNFGDFVMNPQSVEIIEYFLGHNPGLEIIVSTNGSARDQEFWQRLGALGIVVVFAVDGLEDTNHLHRQDTNFQTIMKNAKYFIDAGGHAHWKMLKFEFNQEDRAQLFARAQSLGFNKAWIENTVRDFGPVYNRQGEKIHFIRLDRADMPNKIDQEWIDSRDTWYDSVGQKNTGVKQISCWAQKNHSIYLAADGHVYPCCYVGFNPHEFKPLNTHRYWNAEINQYISNNHAPTVGLIRAIEWFHELAPSWHTDRQPGVCKNFCGK
jgi:MoaA/NifB/PqqE/SkfB family radical SAM enzyme